MSPSDILIDSVTFIYGVNFAVVDSYKEIVLYLSVFNKGKLTYMIYIRCCNTKIKIKFISNPFLTLKIQCPCIQKDQKVKKSHQRNLANGSG